ncbi:MAG: hypothetical protein JZU65_21660 [Chlorobium sp.]|nr:hypothetical protein [Chlorobium sp.]
MREKAYTTILGAFCCLQFAVIAMAVINQEDKPVLPQSEMDFYQHRFLSRQMSMF